MIDFTILTQKEYYKPKTVTPYTQNILDEYQLLKAALERKGFIVERTYWDNPKYDYTKTKAVVFRTIWDYYSRSNEFFPWLKKVEKQTKLINPNQLVNWNLHKGYLKELEEKGIKIVPTVFLMQGENPTLKSICESRNWKNVVIKPAIAGGAFLTYKIMSDEITKHEELFEKLCAERDMLVQEYQSTITTKGEASLMVFNGTFTHAILKKAKAGDYRVQDDYGGTVHPYFATKEEIEFAEKIFSLCEPLPAYGRADILWDEQNNFYLSELEIVEPELWVRFHPESAELFAQGLIRILNT